MNINKKPSKKDQKNKARGKIKIFNVASRYLQQIVYTHTHTRTTLVSAPKLTFNVYKLQGIVCIVLLAAARYLFPVQSFLRKQLKIFSKMDFYYMFGEHWKLNQRFKTIIIAHSVHFYSPSKAMDGNAIRYDFVVLCVDASRRPMCLVKVAYYMVSERACACGSNVSKHSNVTLRDSKKIYGA